MKYPTSEDEVVKQATMAWMTDQFDGDEERARQFIKMQLASFDLWDRGFTWTDI